jgi:hypothetical protein
MTKRSRAGASYFPRPSFGTSADYLALVVAAAGTSSAVGFLSTIVLGRATAVSGSGSDGGA